MLTIPRSKRLLGVCFVQHVLRICEVELPNGSTSGPMPVVARAAEFPLEREGPWPEDPSAAEAMGKSLGKFLSDRGFSAGKAAFGIPARWLIAQPHQIPPADAETAAAILRMHASQRMPPDLGEMVFDYAGEASPAHATTVFLAAIQRRRIEQLRIVAHAARLHLVSILPTSCAVVAAAPPSPQQSGRASLVLVLQSDEAEIVGQENGQPLLLRHIRFEAAPAAAAAQPANFLETSPITPAAACIAALRQAAANMPIKAHAPNGFLASPELPAAPEIILCNDRAPQSLIDEIRQAVGQNARSLTLDTSRSDGDRSMSAIAATAVALGAARHSTGQINFLHPRLREPPQKKRDWRKREIIAAAAIILAIASAAIDLARLHSQATAANGELASLQSSLQQARPFVADMQFLQSFQGDSPHYVACLCNLTAAMPAGSPTRLTAFSLATDMHGEITGRTARQQDVIDYAENPESTSPHRHHSRHSSN